MPCVFMVCVWMCERAESGKQRGEGWIQKAWQFLQLIEFWSLFKWMWTEDNHFVRNPKTLYFVEGRFLQQNWAFFLFASGQYGNKLSVTYFC